jgi:hypothetical protein
MTLRPGVFLRPSIPAGYNRGHGGLAMFRFTIRDVLWLTVVVALGAGLWKITSDRARLAEQNQQRVAAQRLSNLSVGSTPKANPPAGNANGR